MDRVGDIADEALRGLLPAEKHGEYRVALAWAKAVGPELAAKTRPVRLAKSTLTVATENNVWANQLGYMSDELRERLNAEIGEELVEHIRFVVKPDEEE